MVVFVIGMHRSGTSLMSSYLVRCGISMGENLAKAGVGNKHGHFEDRDFLDLHKKILRYNSCNMYAPKDQMYFRMKDIIRARRIVEKKNEMNINWGCKDPRAALFLDLWGELLESPKYLILYRNPYQVIDSLFRRKGEYFFYLKPWMTAGAWLEYNRKALELFDKNPDKCLMVNIEGFNNNHEKSVAVLQEWLDYPLNEPYSSVYTPQDLSIGISLITKAYMPLINLVYGKQMAQTYAALESRAIIGQNGLNRLEGGRYGRVY